MPTAPTSIQPAAFVLFLTLALVPFPGQNRSPGLPVNDLTISLSASPNPVPSGGRLTVRMTVLNNGPDDAPSALVTSAVPIGTTFVSASASQGSPTDLPQPGGIGRIQYQLGPVAALATATVTAVFDVTTQPGSTVAVTADVDHDFNSDEPDETNDMATLGVPVVAGAETADLALVANGATATAGSGSLFSYQLRVTNLSQPLPGNEAVLLDPASNVAVTVSTPEGTTFSSAASSQGSVETPGVGASGQLVYSLGTLDPAGSATLTLTVAVAAAPGGQLALTAVVSSSATDPQPSNNTANVTTPVQASGQAMLSFDPPLPGPVTFAPPRNLRVVPIGAARVELGPPAPPVIGYKIYRSNQPGVTPTPGQLLATLPPTQTNSTVPSAPGGTFYVVTACYPDGESAPSNEGSAGIPAAIPTGFKASATKLVVTGSNFTDTVTVSFGTIGFSSPAKVKKNNTRVQQKGLLQNGQTAREYIRANPVGLILIRNSNGGIAAIRYGEQ